MESISGRQSADVAGELRRMSGIIDRCCRFDAMYDD